MPKTEERTDVPAWAGGGENPDKITARQREYILSLLDQHEVSEQHKERLMKCLRISEDPEEYGMGKRQASQTITWLKEQPRKAAQSTDGKTTMAEVPAGRYAVEAANGELRFYRVWRGTRNTSYIKLYLQHGPDETEIPFGSSMQTVLGNINRAGVREAAIRYGHEIGACSNCGRRLTNRISRELGIGPVCGGRLWEDFGEQIKTARDTITARGEDPDEELE